MEVSRLKNLMKQSIASRMQTAKQTKDQTTKETFLSQHLVETWRKKKVKKKCFI
jgi:hypothetical protein